MKLLRHLVYEDGLQQLWLMVTKRTYIAAKKEEGLQVVTPTHLNSYHNVRIIREHILQNLWVRKKITVYIFEIMK